MTTEGLFRALASCLKSGLEMITGAAVDLEARPAGTQASGESDLWWRQACTVGGLASEVSIGAPESLWKRICGATDDESAKELFFEALTQATLRVLDDMQREIGTAIAPLQGGESKAPRARVHCRTYQVRCDDNSAIGDLEVVVDGVLVRAVEKSQAASTAAADVRRESLANLNAAVSSERSTREPAAEPIAARILDIPLPASIRIAQTVMPIREVLRLTSGAVVELGKYSGEPVEIVVHGTVLARGELVSVKGYYGVRITEIVTRTERLAAIGVPQMAQGRGTVVMSA